MTTTTRRRSQPAVPAAPCGCRPDRLCYAHYLAVRHLRAFESVARETKGARDGRAHLNALERADQIRRAIGAAV